MKSKNLKRGRKKYIFAMLGFFLICGCGISVYAVPATLQSSSSVIYEQASEGSAPVGNLIQDSTFELLGEITAEDGSRWYVVSDANGATGYMKGDAAIEAVKNPEENNEEGNIPEEGNPEAGEASSIPENDTEDGAENPAEAPENTDDPEAAAAETPEDISEDAEEEEDAGPEETMTPPIHNWANNQQKTYAIDAAVVKVKQKESAAEVNVIQERQDAYPGISIWRKMDKSLLAGAAALLIALLVIARFWGRIKNEADWAADDWGSRQSRARSRKTDRRKRKNRRRKSRKKKLKKEIGKKQKATGKEESGYAKI